MERAERFYFDNAATSFPKPAEVYEAMDRCAREAGGNAGRGAHDLSLTGSRLLSSLRHELAALIGGDPNLVVLTKNATEAINIVLLGLLKRGATVAHGPLEHNAVMRPLSHLMTNEKVRLVEVPGDAQGRIAPDTLRRTLAEQHVDLVVTLHCSNVHGLAQDLDGLAEVCRRRRVPLVVDAAQSAGALPIDMEGMRIDALCLTGHKGLFGPTGTGALVLGADIADRIPPLLYGGTGSVSERENMPDFLPDRLEAGTPNTCGAAGLLAGVGYLARRTVADVAGYETELRQRMLERLRSIDGLRLLGDVPGPAVATVSFTAPLLPGDLAHLLQQQYGVAVRAGLHCAPRAHRTLGTMPAGALRLAPGPLTPLDAVDEVTDAIARIVSALA